MNCETPHVLIDLDIPPISMQVVVNKYYSTFEKIYFTEVLCYKINTITIISLMYPLEHNGLFHLGSLVGNYGFFEGRDQYLLSRL